MVVANPWLMTSLDGDPLTVSLVQVASSLPMFLFALPAGALQYHGWCKGLSKAEEKQWARSIRDVPSLHDLKVHEITTEHVLDALKPIWSVKPVTAPRTRQQIERLMDAAHWQVRIPVRSRRDASAAPGERAGVTGASQRRSPLRQARDVRRRSFRQQEGGAREPCDNA
jgi:hypothetical protein